MSLLTKARIVGIIKWVLVIGAPLLPLIPLSQEISIGPATFLWVIVGMIVGWRILNGPDSGWTMAFLLLMGLVSLIQVGQLVNRMDQYHGLFVAMMTAWVIIWVVVAFILNSLETKFNSEGAAAEARIRQEQDKQTQRARELEYADRVRRQRDRIDRPSKPGVVTGFEPQNLEGVRLVSRPLIHGTPGAGLSGSDFSEANIERGQAGEENFAKALQVTGGLERFATFWSVHMPDGGLGASRDLKTDIDCAILTGDTLWLVDVKNYFQGDVTWRTEIDSSAEADPKATPDRGWEVPRVLIAFDNTQGVNVGPPRSMSRNMELAKKRFEERLRASYIRIRVMPVVVMMPQRSGMGQLEDVYWPGQVPAMSLPDFLQQLRTEPPFDPANEDAVVASAIIGSLVKDETGTALHPGTIPKPPVRGSTAPPRRRNPPPPGGTPSPSSFL